MHHLNPFVSPLFDRTCIYVVTNAALNELIEASFTHCSGLGPRYRLSSTLGTTPLCKFEMWAACIFFSSLLLPPLPLSLLAKWLWLLLCDVCIGRASNGSLDRKRRYINNSCIHPRWGDKHLVLSLSLSPSLLVLPPPPFSPLPVSPSPFFFNPLLLQKPAPNFVTICSFLLLCSQMCVLLLSSSCPPPRGC